MAGRGDVQALFSPIYPGFRQNEEASRTAELCPYSWLQYEGFVFATFFLLPLRGVVHDYPEESRPFLKSVLNCCSGCGGVCVRVRTLHTLPLSFPLSLPPSVWLERVSVSSVCSVVLGTCVS